MKFATSLLVLLGATMTSAVALHEETVNDCSLSGGLFNVTSLPEGVTSHRKCAGHPLGQPESEFGVVKRDCARRSYGCEKKFCWKKCSTTDGPWCWQAWDRGFGGWVGCSKDSDCEPKKLARADCGICEKSSCGCSC
ncbi:hypothetical protein B0J11DRAFT_317534 [Dendryphion nanum]|uniref:Uncharacterized protein n=1 Tax=Dendryphion nanum TaxID=256645 RepID=A0A9P9IKG8_9PLEO|nr:hypothetical protein B0J11DRAFT_317534 [Dendryphion nanum]